MTETLVAAGRPEEAGVARPGARASGAGQLLSEPWDVVVAGGGNAALVAAIMARRGCQRVLLLERAPAEFRGGNTRHTRNVRCVHDHADEFCAGRYGFEELWDDLCNVGTGPSDEELARITVAESATIPGWMAANGVRWQRPLSGTLQLGRTNRFFLGGGKALINTYYRAAAAIGIAVVYEAGVEGMTVEGDRCTAVLVRLGDRVHEVRTRALVCASGGFEANLEWLRRYWGDAVDNYVIRGPRYNDGTVLAALYDHGAAAAGQEKGFHAIAVDARAPRYDGGIATRLDCVPFGIVLNRSGERFYDEGEELWPKRYAIWGRKIAEQPGQVAFALWDAKVNRCFLPPMYGPACASTIPELATLLGQDPDRVGAEVDAFNAAVRPGRFDPTRLDDCTALDLPVPKSHWAQRLDTPPYYGIAMRPGITFTYMGVAIDSTARVARADGSRFENVFAAGEIMSGNVLSSGYMAGFGLTIGSVWGRIAGKEAARAE